jgi:hypothetical protein
MPINFFNPKLLPRHSKRRSLCEGQSCVTESTKSAILAIRRDRMRPSIYYPTEPFLLDREPIPELEGIVRFRIGGNVRSNREIVSMVLALQKADANIREIPPPCRFRSAWPSFMEGSHEAAERAIPPPPPPKTDAEEIAELRARIFSELESKDSCD